MRNSHILLRAAGLTAASLLAATTMTGVATAQTNPLGSLSQSTPTPGNAVYGSLNTTGSFGIGEPTLAGLGLGSVQPLYTQSISGLPIAQDDALDQPVLGSVDTRFCGEPTADNIPACVSALAGAASSTNTNSLGDVDSGSLLSLVAVGGSIALAGAAVANGAVPNLPFAPLDLAALTVAANAAIANLPVLDLGSIAP